MKPLSPHRLARTGTLAARILAGSIAALLSASFGHAATLYWDGNGTTAGAGSTPAGTWGSDAFWSTSSIGTLATSAYISASDVVFSAGRDAGTFTVGLTTAQDAASLLFEEGNTTLSGTGGILTLSGTGGKITVNGGATATIGNNTSTVIGGGTGLTKLGAGTLTLNGSAVNTFTGGLNVNVGTLALDFANLVTPTNLIDSGNALTLGGGALTLKGKSSGTTLQTFAGTSVIAGGGSILVNPNGGTSTTVELGTLGTLSSWTAGSSLLAGKAIGAGGGTVILTTTTDKDATGIYGGRIVFGNGTANTGYDWTTTASGSSPYTLSAYSGYSTLAASGTDTSNSRITASNFSTGDITTNSLKIEAPAAGQYLALGANALTLTSGGLLSTGTNALTVFGSAATAITAGNGSGAYDLVVHQYNSGGLTIAAAIGDNGANATSLTKAGTGTLTINGQNAHTGGTFLNGGTLSVTADNAFGAVPVAAATNLTFGASSTLKVTGGFTLNANRDIAINNGANATFDLINSAAYTLNVGGVISGTGSLTLAGGGSTHTGNLHLKGTNTYTGGTFMTGNAGQGGGITIYSDASLGTAPSTPTPNITFGTGYQVGLTWATPFDLDSNRTIVTNGGTGWLNFASGQNITLGNQITGTGGLNLTSLGTGSVTLTNTSNTYQGVTGISGMLKIGSDSVLGTPPVSPATNISFSSNPATLQLLASVDLHANRNFAATSGSGYSFTIDTQNFNMTIPGVLGLGGHGLTKAGSGTLTLGGANTYTYLTTINGGLLRFNGISTGSSAVTINKNAGLGGTGTIPGSVTAAVGDASNAGGAVRLTDGATGTLTLGSTLTFSGTAAFPNNAYFDLGSGVATTDKIVTTGAVTAAGAGAVIVNLNQLSGGAVTAGLGKVLIQAGAASTYANYALATTRSGGNVYSNLTASGNNLVVDIATATAGPAAAFWAGGANPWTTAANWNTTVDGEIGTGAIPGVGTNVTFATTTPVPGNLTTNTVDADFEINSLTFNDSAGGVTIAGTKVLTLDATNANLNTAGNGITSGNTSGTNTISAKIGLGGNQTWTTSGGALTVSGAISDFGGGYSLTKAGTGTLALSGANAYFGGTTISDGTLQIGTGGTTGSLSPVGALVNNATLAFNRSNTITQGTEFSPVISGSGALTQAGTSASILILNGTNSYGGLTTVSSGTLRLGSAGDATNGPLGTIAAGTTVAATGAALDLNGFTLATAEALTLNGTGISSGGALLNSSTSTAATYSGLITLGSSSSIVASTNAAGSIILSNTGTITGSGFGLTLSGTGSASSVASIIGTDAGTLTKTGTGTWTLTGNNTYTGLTDVQVGTLILGRSGGTINDSAPVQISGGTLAVAQSDTVGAVTLSSGTISGAGTLTGSSYALTNTGTISANLGSNAATLTKTGGGTAILSGTNNFTGATTLTAGTLSVGADGNLGDANSLVFDGGTLQITGTDLTSFGGGMIGTHAVTLNAGKTVGFDINNAANTFTVSETLNQTTGGLAKSGAGVLELIGNNTYTGLTTVSAGRLVLSGNNVTATGGMTISGGAAQFDSVASINGTLRNVTATGPGAVVFGPAFETGTDIPDALANRIVATSTGAIAADNYTATNFDFATPGLTAASFGAVGTVTYAGTLTPNGTTYRLGGGGGTLIFTPASYTNTNALILNGNGNLGTVEFDGQSLTFGAITFAGGTVQNGELTGSSYTNTTGVTVGVDLAGSGAFTPVGTVTLTGDNSGYSGNYSVGSGITLKGTSLGTGTVTLSTGTLGLVHDGTGSGLGNGMPESINYGTDVTVSGNSTITVGRLTAPAAANSFLTNAANKTLQLDGLGIGAQTLTVTPSNGFGLEFAGATVLTAAPTFSVGNATASNLVQGLTLTGQITGAFGITKSGAGTLVMDDATNTFGTGGSIINITDGILQVSSNGALGDAANLVHLGANNATKGLRLAGGTAATPSAYTLTGRTIRLNAAASGIDVTQFTTATLDTAFTSSAPANTLQKNDNGVLAFASSVDNSSLTGAWTISAGAIRISGASNLNASANALTVSNVVGSALQLTNGVTLNKAGVLTINNSGLDSAGSLQSVGAFTNAVSSLITLGSAATIGADTGSTLNLTGGISGAFGLTFNTAGTGAIKIATTAISNTVTPITKIGSGTLTFDVTSPSVVAPINVNAGVFDIKTGVLGATGLVSVAPGATLNLTSTSANRLGGRPLTLGGGILNFSGATNTETTGAFTLNAGQSIINNTSLQILTLGAAAPAFANSGRGATALFKGGSTIKFGAAPVLSGSGANGTNTKGILPWAIFDAAGGLGSSFGTTDVTAGNLTTVRALAGSEGANSLAAGVNAVLTSNPAATNTGSVNSLTFDTGSTVVAINAPSLPAGAVQTLTISSGGILSNVATSSISGGVLAVGNANIFTPGASEGANVLSITSAITGTTLTKAGAGTLELNSVSSAYAGYTANSFAGGSHDGGFFINEGTVKLGASNALYQYSANDSNGLTVNSGGKLDLNGKTQLVGPLLSQGFGANVMLNANSVAGGTITSSTGTGNIIAITGNPSGNGQYGFTGSITGANVGFAVGGSGVSAQMLLGANTYGGPTLIDNVGSTTVIGLILKNDGTISNTSDLTINRGALVIDNTGLSNNNDRVSNTAPIYMNGGNLFYLGRAQNASTETVGGINLVQGVSTITVTTGGTGVNSADLTVGSIARPAGSGATVAFTLSGTGGAAGSGNGRINVSSPATLTAAMVGGIIPWAAVGAQFATYIPYGTDNGVSSGGIGTLGTAGYGAYASTATSYDNVNQPTWNGYAGATTITGAVTLNSLGVNGTTLNFTNPSDSINVVSGGLLVNGNVNTIGATLDSGRITAGGTASSGTVDLYFWSGTGNNNSNTLNSRIVDNGNGAKTRLVLNFRGDGNRNLTMNNGANSYTGGTVLNTSATLNATSGVVIPDDATGLTGLIVNNSTVTMNNSPGQIGSGNIVTLNSSTLNLFASNTLAGLSLNALGGGSTVNTTGGTLILTGDITTTGNGIFGSTINGSVSLAPGSTLNIGAATFNGQILNPLAADLTLTSPLTGGGGAMTKSGTGVLQFNASAALSPGSLDVTGGGLQIGVANFTAGPVDLTLQDGTWLNLSGFATTFGSLAGTAAGIVTNTSTSAATLTVGGTNASTTFAGSFKRFNDQAINTINLTKVGTGTMTLTGMSNTAFGVTTISAGTLQFGKQASLYDNTPASWTAPNIKVANGATLALNVGGTDEFTNGDVSTLLTNLGGLGGAPGSGNGLQAGSAVGFDTTNASPATFTVANNIANSTGAGGGAIGLTKLGTNTLELTGTNLYTGATTVSAGTLSIGTGGSLANTAVTVQSAGTLAGVGTIGGSTTIEGIHSPGSSAGLQTFTNGLAYASTSTLLWELMANTESGRGSNFDAVDVTGGSFSITSGATLDLSFGGTVSFVDSFWNAAHTWTIADLGIGLTGDGGSDVFTLGSITGGSYSPSEGTFTVTRVADGDGKNDVVLNWAASTGSPYQTWINSYGAIPIGDRDPEDDYDNDGVTNLAEFAFKGVPNDASNRGLFFNEAKDNADGDSDKELTFTCAVRRSAVNFAANGDNAQESVSPIDEVTYTIEGSTTLTGTWNSVVSYVGKSDTAPSGSGLPSLASTDWEYRTFSAFNGMANKGFLRTKIERP